MDDSEPIIGRYERLPNPCTTKPCLPGMADAVVVHDRSYFLTVDGHWVSEKQAWRGYSPQPGDLVRVTGRVRQQTDVFGQPFYTLEVTALDRVTNGDQPPPA